MKPFNLKDALDGAPVVTRDGRKVKRVIHVPEFNKKNNRVISIYEDGDGYDLVGEDGIYFADGSISGADLFMAPKKRTVWVNLYRERLGQNDHKPCMSTGYGVFKTPEDAKVNQIPEWKPIGTFPIEFEE